MIPRLQPAPAESKAERPEILEGNIDGGLAPFPARGGGGQWLRHRRGGSPQRRWQGDEEAGRYRRRRELRKQEAEVLEHHQTGEWCRAGSGGKRCRSG